MEKIITIISTENLTVEDYFRGNHEAHKVEGLIDTYAIVKAIAQSQSAIQCTKADLAEGSVIM